MTVAAQASEFRIDLINLCLWRSNGAASDERLELAPKTFDVLRYLVDNAGRLVTHDELLTALWRGVHVQPEVLKTHIFSIRNALGDKSTNPQFIETLRGRGYRFIGPLSQFVPMSEQAATLEVENLLAGRAEAIAELHASFQQASAGQSQVVMVSGEPGIGKTALVREFVAQILKGWGFIPHAQGNCIEGFAGIEPYYPVLEALGRLCSGPTRGATLRTVLKLAPAWAAQMAELRTQEPENPPLPIEVARSRMVREGANLLEALAAEQPLLLILEDLHWADYATVDLLSALCRRQSAAKLMVIVTYRSEELGSARHPLAQMTHDLAARKYCRRIELNPLPRPAIVELLAGGHNGEAVAGEFSQFIEEWSGGNPLFIELILEFLQEHAMARRTGRRWRLLAPLDKSAFATPPSLGRILQAKMDSLPDMARHVMEAGSVVGLQFDAATAAPAAEMAEHAFEETCEEYARGNSFIRWGDLITLPGGQQFRTYVFKHAAFRQVVYDTIGPSRRARLHHIVASRLEAIHPADKRSDVAVQLAQHFATARDFSRALDYLRLALHVANSRFARRDALVIVERACELATNLPGSERVMAELEFLERRGAIQAATRDPMARDSYVKLSEQAGHYGRIDVQCRALICLAYVMSWNDLLASRSPLDQALALCEKQADPVQRDVTQVLAYARRLWGFGWNSEDAQRCEEALTRLRSAGDSLSIAQAQIHFSLVCLISTRYRQAHDLVESAYRVFSETPQNQVEADLARAFWMRQIGVPWCQFLLGEFGAAWNEFSASIAAFEKNADPSAACSFHVYRGVLRFYALDFEGVLHDCEKAMQTSGESQGAPTLRVLPVERRIAYIFSGLAKCSLNRLRPALDDLRAAEAEMNRQPAHLDWYWRLALEWGMVNLLVAQGLRSDGLRRAKGFCELAAQTQERAWQALAWEAHARAALAFGDSAQAVDHAAKALTACAGAKVPTAELRVQATCAIVFKASGDMDRARAHGQKSEILRKQLADSLPKTHPLRAQFERNSASLLSL